MVKWRSISKIGYPTDMNKKYLVSDGKDISTSNISGKMHFKGDGNPTFTFTEWLGDDNTYEYNDWLGDDNTYEYNDCYSGVVIFDMKPTHWSPIEEVNLPELT